MRKSVHISVDDVEYVFINLIINADRFESIFEVPLLRYIKKMHKRYGAKFTLYGYAYPSGHKLSELPEKFRSEFQQTSDWLKFGFHWGTRNYNQCIDDETVINDCKTFYNEVERFAGITSISSTIRLHYFHPSNSLYSKLVSLKWLSNGMVLLCADLNDRLSYDLSRTEVKKMYHNRKIEKPGRAYIPSDLRIESNRGGNRLIYSNLNNIVIFTHEWAITSTGIRDCLLRLIGKSALLPSIYLRYKLSKLIKTLSLSGYNFTI